MDKSQNVYLTLNRLIPQPKTELHYSSNFELLVAVILSAQCTDKRVNMVTSELFKSYSTPTDFMSIKQEQLEQLIKPCGFYKSKAQHIIKCATQIVTEYNQVVPDDFDKLLTLSGVGRKTANVIMSVAFNKPGLGVDTHVFRVANRIGLVKAKSPKDCELKLKKMYEPTQWGTLHHLLVLFGRYTCKSRNPQCESCVLKENCNYYKKENK